LHIDGDSFFASCEVAQNPELRGKCVITGKERGIAASMSYEAKARGVKRGMLLHEIKKLCPEAVILPSDYETYSIYSKRMFEIVRRFTPEVEEYSIDECFGDLTGLRRTLRMSYPEMARKIKHDLDSELGMTFSVGLAPSKTLAKVGSKWKKPNGLTVIPGYLIHNFLEKLPVGKVWGIGPNTEELLRKHGVYTALDFVNKPESWVNSCMSKPYKECWQELRGKAVFGINTEEKHDYQSIQKVKTFTPPSSHPEYVFSQLSKNVENACIKLRRHNLTTDNIYFFLKTQDFKYLGKEIKIPHRVNTPEVLLKEIRQEFDAVFNPRLLYRGTGVTFTNLKDVSVTQLDLFQQVTENQKTSAIYKQLDTMNAKYGKHAVFLCSSLLTKNTRQHLSERGDIPQRSEQLLRGETARQHLNIPFLGTAK
jgi:DNA polymerase IV